VCGHCATGTTRNNTTGSTAAVRQVRQTILCILAALPCILPILIPHVLCLRVSRRLLASRGKMVWSTTVDERGKTRTRALWKFVRLSILCALFASLFLLCGWTYFSLRCELHQLRADVDQLKAVHSAAAPAGFLGDRQNVDKTSAVDLKPRRRSKRQDAFNESDSNNETSSHDEDADDGSGEVVDQQYRGIWMGTYSRVPVSYSEAGRYLGL